MIFFKFYIFIVTYKWLKLKGFIIYSSKFFIKSKLKLKLKLNVITINIFKKRPF